MKPWRFKVAELSDPVLIYNYLFFFFLSRNTHCLWRICPVSFVTGKSGKAVPRIYSCDWLVQLGTQLCQPSDNRCFKVGLGVEQKVAFTFLQRRKIREYFGSPKKLNTNLQRPDKWGFIANPWVTGSCSLNDIEPIRLGLSEEETSARTIDLRILFQQIPKRESQPLRRKYPVFKSGLRLSHTGGRRAFENCSESRGCREQPPSPLAHRPLLAVSGCAGWPSLCTQAAPCHLSGPLKHPVSLLSTGFFLLAPLPVPFPSRRLQSKMSSSFLDLWRPWTWARHLEWFEHNSVMEFSSQPTLEIHL